MARAAAARARVPKVGTEPIAAGAFALAQQQPRTEMATRWRTLLPGRLLRRLLPLLQQPRRHLAPGQPARHLKACSSGLVWRCLSAARRPPRRRAAAALAQPYTSARPCHAPARGSSRARRIYQRRQRLPTEPKDEVFHRWSQQHSLEGLDLAEIGLVLKCGVLHSGLPLGHVARTLSSTAVGEAASASCGDVLPLPLPTTCAAERRALAALRGGAAPRGVTRGHPKTMRTLGISSWLFLIIAVLNYMHCGLSSVELQLPGVSQQVNPAQASALAYLEKQATLFASQPGCMPDTDWGAFLQM